MAISDLSPPVDAEEIVYVLLPVHNRRDTTSKFLDCLAKQTYPRIHLILLDDGSTDDTSSIARSCFPQLTVLRGDGNWWWAGSLQHGHEWLRKNARAPSDIVLIINDDTTFESEFIECSVRVLRSRTRALLNDFATAFDGAAHVILLDVYAARETVEQGSQSDVLFEMISRTHESAWYARSPAEAVILAMNLARRGDTIVTMGAGDVGSLGEEILSALTLEARP